MATDPNNCAICNRPPADGVKMRNSGVPDCLLIDCPQCGRYELFGGQTIWESYQWTPELKKALSCATRQASEAGQPLQLTHANAEEFAEPHKRTRVSDNQERLLRVVNQITDEIIAEIRDAEFVIADFSGNRGGVYYEAGFARGLGRPVIHCCRESDFKQRHFDTQLINHIKWLDPADLRQKLANRIKATIIPTA